MTFFAHTHPNGREHWEPLETHLREVADVAAEFADAFECGHLGYAVGRWHDLGKASNAFQEKVLGGGLNEVESDPDGLRPRARVDHATAGARYAMRQLGANLGPWLAAPIAGHHAHLPDWNPAFRTRMLFSCLVDSDRLCTERFCVPDGFAQRPTALDLEPEAMPAVLDTAAADEARAGAFADCREAAEKPAGWFILEVPTGGGKTLTLASLESPPPVSPSTTPPTFHHARGYYDQLQSDKSISMNKLTRPELREKPMPDPRSSSSLPSSPPLPSCSRPPTPSTVKSNSPPPTPPSCSVQSSARLPNPPLLDRRAGMRSQR